MENFNFSYDSENDDLFIYLKDKKSKGAIELGNFVLDFDAKGNLVAMQILNAQETLSKFFQKVAEISKIKEIKLNIVNLRNMEAIKFSVFTDLGVETTNILVPHIKEKSPVLSY